MKGVMGITAGFGNKVSPSAAWAQKRGRPLSTTIKGVRESPTQTSEAEPAAVKRPWHHHIGRRRWTYRRYDTREMIGSIVAVGDTVFHLRGDRKPDCRAS